jgi:hypothetical protein
MASSNKKHETPNAIQPSRIKSFVFKYLLVIVIIAQRNIESKPESNVQSRLQSSKRGISEFIQMTDISTNDQHINC